MRKAAIVDRALHSGLWHARILEAHLDSTVRAIRRHAVNKWDPNGPPRMFRMTEADAASGYDVFLGRSGPPSLDFPFHRDICYMLVTYLPNRWWNGELQRWMYGPESQHDADCCASGDMGGMEGSGDGGTKGGGWSGGSVLIDS